MNILSYLQKIGRALMVPVATLPAAAILMGVGYWIDPNGWGADNGLAALLIKSGAAIIDNMSMLFAIGVAYGMSKDKDGAAALAGFVGFIVVTTLCSPNAVSMIQNIAIEQVPAAFHKINNQFIGIVVGLITAATYNRFSQVELHKILAFFSGRRLVPILTSFIMILLATILMFVWPFIYTALVHFGEYIQRMGSLGAGLYAFFNRLLLPIGLHHALNSVFWFDVAGINDIPNFLAGQGAIDSGRAITGITGRYQAGYFPIMMFGLPAAALAIYHTAYIKNRNKVAGIMLAGAVASFFTGVTEPIEFAFLFVAPLLFVIHAVLTGISVFIAASMQWIAGFGFSAGLVDLILSSRNPLATEWYMLIPLGALFFVIYYLTFRFVIVKFNLSTPGREVESEEINHHASTDKGTQIVDYITALGGAENLINIDACITRLRLTVKDANQIDEESIKRLGALAVVRLNHQSVQVIIGTQAESVANSIRQLLAETQQKD